MKKIPVETCPMFGDLCRHCSIEKASGQVTLLKPDIHTGMLVSAGSSFNVMELGAWCNNVSKWVADMHYCPVRWQAANAATTTPAPQQRWKVRTDADTRKGREVLQIGQQKLLI